MVSDRSKWPAHLLAPAASTRGSSFLATADKSRMGNIGKDVSLGPGSSGRFVYLSMGDCSARHVVAELPKSKAEPKPESKTESKTKTTLLLPKENRSSHRSAVLYSRTMTFSSPSSGKILTSKTSPTRRRQLLNFLLPKLPADGAARARAAELSGRVVSGKNRYTKGNIMK